MEEPSEMPTMATCKIALRFIEKGARGRMIQCGNCETAWFNYGEYFFPITARNLTSCSIMRKIHFPTLVTGCVDQNPRVSVNDYQRIHSSKDYGCPNLVDVVVILNLRNHDEEQLLLYRTCWTLSTTIGINFFKDDSGYSKFMLLNAKKNGIFYHRHVVAILNLSNYCEELLSLCETYYIPSTNLGIKFSKNDFGYFKFMLFTTKNSGVVSPDEHPTFLLMWFCRHVDDLSDDEPPSSTLVKHHLSSDTTRFDLVDVVSLLKSPKFKSVPRSTGESRCQTRQPTIL
ncbi:hypothetical protein GmHk_01G001348 [Glycine max]|nr:hypothetical protein GmHk_01G001348 [Glycine max]